jgi:hypothetical protein
MQPVQFTNPHSGSVLINDPVNGVIAPYRSYSAHYPSTEVLVLVQPSQNRPADSELLR